MRCENCDNPLNEWQDICEVCKFEIIEFCKCHNKPVKYVKGSYLGLRDLICSISGNYCEVK